jgi:TonB family protein
MGASQIPTLRFKILRDGAVIAEKQLTEDSISIGCDANAMLIVEGEGVGGLHAVINVDDDGSVNLLDLGTPAGTVFNGERISSVTLSPGDHFQIGGVQVMVNFDEVESTTPTMDVRPEVPVAAPAAPLASDYSEEEDEVGDAVFAQSVEDIMDIVMRSGTGATNLGIDTKAPKVLEVNQIWSNLLLDARHFKRGSDVTIGASVGYRWSLVGVPLGYVPKAVVGALRVSPPIWSEVQGEWSTDFYTNDDSLPANQDHKLFVSEGNNFVARIDSHWDGFADVGDKRYALSELEAAGLARKSGNFLEVPITEDTRIGVDIDGVVFFAHLVHPGKKVIAKLTDSLEYGLLASILFFAVFGAMFAVLMMTTPKPAMNDTIELDENFVELLLEKPEPEEDKKKDDKPDANPDAGEGAKAKKEEGKVGKKDAKMKKAKGNKVDVQQTQRDREIAESAGVLGALNDAGGLDGVFGSSGLDSNLTGGLGGLIGAKGVQIGAGGLGSRGSGLGGGGSAEGLGGLGTKGLGSGKSGFGSGGGSFGAKGSGGISARTGDPIVMGALDRSLIDQVIKRKMSQIRYCYQRELQKDPSLAGKVVIKFTIAGDGKVSSASTKSSTIGNSAVDKCVVSRFYSMTFPKPKGGGIVIVSYPFIFSPG